MADSFGTNFDDGDEALPQGTESEEHEGEDVESINSASSSNGQDGHSVESIQSVNNNAHQSEAILQEVEESS